jgi:hypothetical protein
MLSIGLAALHWHEMTDPWKHHRILKRIGVTSALLMFLTFASVALGIVNENPRGSRIFIYCWMLLVLVMLILTHEARCPRCGRRFYARGLDFRQMTKKCLHCGQKKYAELAATPNPDPG